MQFEKCPRCGGDWEDDLRNKLCALCDISFSPTACMLGLRLPNRRKLVWDWSADESERECLYCTYNSNGRLDTMTNMPWLPFDITEERLKLLLTFL